VAELAISKATYREMSRVLGVSLSTIRRDIGVIRKIWREATLRDANEVIGEELATLDLVQMELIALIRRAAQPTTQLSAVERLMSVMRRRACLLGLDAPSGHLLGAVVEHRDSEGRPLTDEDRFERATLAERVIQMVEREFPDLPAELPSSSNDGAGPSSNGSG
jgi:hypothetical protein